MKGQKSFLMQVVWLVASGSLALSCAVGADDKNSLLRCDAIDKFSTKHHLQLRIDAQGKPGALTYKTMSRDGQECLIETAQGRSFGMRDSSEWILEGDRVIVQVRDGSEIAATLRIEPNAHQGFTVEIQAISYEVFCGVRGFLVTKIGVDRNGSACTLFEQ